MAHLISFRYSSAREDGPIADNTRAWEGTEHKDSSSQPSFLDGSDDPDVVSSYTPTHRACDASDGIYHIGIADIEGGVGTALFQLVIAQILYAEARNLTPWVYFVPNVSRVIEDPLVHRPKETSITFRAQTGRSVTSVKGRSRRDVTPGPLNQTQRITQEQLQFAGTGIWGHYFEPVSTFVPGDRSCENKLYATIGLDDIYLIIPGLHGYADNAVRCWRYDYLPEYVSKPHQSLHSWLAPQRERAARVVQLYFRFRPYLRQRADMANPDCSINHPCLGIHVRHSDKAAGRRVIDVAEFLPYCQQFVNQGGVQIYLATDSAAVVTEIQTRWPEAIAAKVRTVNVVRSKDATAVFDMASHHTTNQEVLVEILALSRCQFMVHGHSAVSEAAIWTNFALHGTSVNLEDKDCLDARQFGELVHLWIARNVPPSQWPRPVRVEDEWPPYQVESLLRQPTGRACDGFDGVLLISAVGRKTTAGGAFFTSVLNQLLFADRNNLKPWIHLQNTTSGLIFDSKVHGVSNSAIVFEMIHGMAVNFIELDDNSNSIYPNQPAQRHELAPKNFTTPYGNGIWSSYFDAVSDFEPGDESCRGKPLIEMEEVLVSPGLEAFCPWSIKAWKYDNIPSLLFNETNTATSMKNWLKPMREQAHILIKKYLRFQPFIAHHAEKANPNVGVNQPCLGVHIRMSDKNGKYRRKVKADEFIPYIDAFERAGGRAVYVATDAQRPLQFMFKNYPSATRLIRTQGDHIVRSVSGEWPTHILDDHHRVNSETLVDILALSKCSLLLHGYSTVSEAAIFLNPILHNNSINLEDPRRMSTKEFERLARDLTGINETMQMAQIKENEILKASPAAEITFRNPRVIRREESGRRCRTNAIIYLAQKIHSSYGRNSYSSLLRSLTLLNENYLSINNHINNTDVFIFHTGDFNLSDLDALESSIGDSGVGLHMGAVHLVDLSDTQFWARPQYNANDNPKDWYAWPLFSEGYRRMMHWFAIDVWDFFTSLNEQSRCEYRYIFRLDEDSFIHSPIVYDIFDRMLSQQYVYGFRMCAYEMKVTQRMSAMWMKRHLGFVPQREVDLDICGFYNNFFVADLKFFQSSEVLQFLRFIDKQGHIYRRRLGDLMIHSMAVYWFAPKEQIHRFLDFTYEHGTVNETDGCLKWGGIQAGYDDKLSTERLARFNEVMVMDRSCEVNTSSLAERDLSPTYAHLPSHLEGKVFLQTITAGHVELPPGKGLLSG